MTKQRIILAGLIVLSFSTFSQDKYDRVISARVEGITTPEALKQLDDSQSDQIYVYYDENGREKEVVVRGASPGGKDMVQMFTYDPTGTTHKSHKGYTHTTSDGSYKQTAFDGAGVAGSQANFYSTKVNVAHDSKPYSQVMMDGRVSPRVIEQRGIGSTAHAHATTFNYSYNVEADKVLLFSYDEKAGLTENGYYAVPALRKTRVTDPDGMIQETYVNDRGQLILQRIVDGLGSGVHRDTYNLYNEKGQISHIIPPKYIEQLLALEAGVSSGETEWVDEPLSIDSYQNKNYQIEKEGEVSMESGFSFRSKGGKRFYAKKSYLDAHYSDLIYEYKYDHKGRMIASKNPGAGWSFVVYDRWNRVVMTQDAEMHKSNTWIYTKYDYRHRPILMGKRTVESSRDVIQIQVDTFYENNTVHYEIDGNALFGYSERAYPSGCTTDELLVVNYYDTYDFDVLNVSALDYVAPDNTYDYPSVRTKGLSTGQRIKNLQTGEWYDRKIYYDSRLRGLQVREIKGSSQKMVATIKTNFIGQPTESVNEYELDAEIVKVKSNYTYDHKGRPTAKTLSVNDQPTIQVSAYSYNELGETIQKKLGVNGSSALQSLDLKFDINGRVVSLNDGMTDANDLFSFNLYYNQALASATTATKHNGSISAFTWQHRGDDGVLEDEHAYQYQYDKANQLKAAVYGDKSGTSANYAWNGNYSTNHEYDANGNMTHVKRWHKDGTKKLMDDLQMVYKGNQLQTVKDLSNNVLGFEDGASEKTEEIFYNKNGNMTKDLNAGITAIEYNILSLPSKITKANGDVTFEYDAGGVKRSRALTGQNAVRMDYLGAAVFENGVPVLLKIAEGTINLKETIAKVQYHLADHQGNVRVVFEEHPSIPGKARILQKQSYYPYGLSFDRQQFGMDEADAQYNGMEWQGQANLDWYDYNARFYNPAIGRFMAVDPIVHFVSPYAYVHNNPINFTDPTGMICEPGDPPTWVYDMNGNRYDLCTPSDMGQAATGTYASTGDGGFAKIPDGADPSSGHFEIEIEYDYSYDFRTQRAWGKEISRSYIWKPNPIEKTDDGCDCVDQANGGANDISERGLELIASFEGFRSKVYKDIAGYETVGFGHKLLSKESYPKGITRKQALALLKKDAQSAVSAVNKFVKVDLNQNQFDALASFAYNIGRGNFRKSSVVRLINTGSASNIDVFEKLINYSYAGGKFSNGLFYRRITEGNWYNANP